MSDLTSLPSMPGFDISQTLLGQPKGIELNKAPNMAEARIEQSAKDFEAMFLNQMLSHMFANVGIDKDSPFYGGKGEEIWRSFMVNEYAKSIADAGGIGIADHVKQHLISLQEK